MDNNIWKRAKRLSLPRHEWKAVITDGEGFAPIVFIGPLESPNEYDYNSGNPAANIPATDIPMFRMMKTYVNTRDGLDGLLQNIEDLSDRIMKIMEQVIDVTDITRDPFHNLLWIDNPEKRTH